MEPSNFERNSGEGVRGKTEEYDRRDMNSLKVYERKAQDRSRDLHISYAKSVAKALGEGMSPEKVLEVMTFELDHGDRDIAELVDPINYFLDQDNTGYKFDQDLNVFNDNRKVAGTVATSKAVSEYIATRAENQFEYCRRMAETIGAHVLGGTPIVPLIAFAVADIVLDGADNVLISEYLNEYLTAKGSSVQFNRYLELISNEDYDVRILQGHA